MLCSVNTERLILRPWRDEDFEPFAQMNADPRVMEYFPSILSREESDRMATRIKEKIENRGWGMWAAVLKESGVYIGFIGLNEVTQETLPAPFSPAVEVGWRLLYDFWGRGLASEGALAALRFGFETLHLEEIVSFTAVENQRSRRVMEKIGMHHHSEDDFDHPKLPEGHRLRRHVLYRISEAEFRGKL